MTLKDEVKTVRSIFVDEYGEPSFKKCVNIQEFGKTLQSKGINLDPTLAENIGPIFICFGDIEYEMKMTYRMPEESEEEKRAALLKKLKEEEEKKAAAEGTTKKKKTKEVEKPPEEEEKKEEVKKEPPQPIKVWLYQTSVHDLLSSIDKMQDYDFVLGEMNLMKSDITEERLKLQGVNAKFPEGNDR